MSEGKVQFKDSLKDVEITIHIRSGHTDLVDLNKLLQVIKTSVASVQVTEIVVAELERKAKFTPAGELYSVQCKLTIN